MNPAQDHAASPDTSPTAASAGGRCAGDEDRPERVERVEADDQGEQGRGPAGSPVDSRVDSRVRVRLWALGVLALTATPLAVAAWLSPDARGYDTHTALGLPACGFPQRWGLPCPTCGMTTAFAWLVRGRILEAARTQFFGALLAAACVVWSLAAAAQLVSGRPVLARVGPRRSWLLPAAALLMAAWALKAVAMAGAAP